jgi:hypothetical protein
MWVEGRAYVIRPPDSLDLLEAAAASQPRRALLERCIVQMEPPETAEESIVGLPAEAQTALLAQMQALDPLAAASFALTCPACGHSWAAPFDILSYLWSEIDAWAYRILREVHWLASAYGWREADILALGPQRRQAYLQMSGYA